MTELWQRNGPDRRTVQLSVTSELLSARALTERIGLAPDRSWSVGDQWTRGDAGRKRATSMWQIGSGLGSASEFDVQLDALWDRVAPTLARLRGPFSALSVVLHVVQHFDASEHQGRGIGIDPRWVALVGAFGGSISFDQSVD